jgi:hypothetical protein
MQFQKRKLNKRHRFRQLMQVRQIRRFKMNSRCQKTVLMIFKKKKNLRKSKIKKISKYLMKRDKAKEQRREVAQSFISQMILSKPKRIQQSFRLVVIEKKRKINQKRLRNLNSNQPMS